MADKDDAPIPESCMWKMLPVMSSALFLAIGWGISVETRIGNMATTQAERAPRIVTLENQVSNLDVMVRDPAPKAETKVEMDAMKDDHKQLSDRLDRLEDRVNNLHNYILSAPPKMLMKRGELPPFTPDPSG